jgi:hypothetical protein
MAAHRRRPGTGEVLRWHRRNGNATLFRITDTHPKLLLTL